MAAKTAIFFSCVLGFSVFASVLRGHFGFPLDDSWIHQTVARNLVNYHVLGFLPGTHSSGSSSLLWTLVLAFQYQFLAFANPVIYCAVVDGLLVGTIGVGLYIFAERDGFSELESWIFALAPLLSGNFLWLGMIGMEHVLFVALSVWSILAWFPGRGGQGWGRVLLAAILVGLLALTRPEGVFLAALLILMKQRASRTWTDCSILALGAALAAGISFRVNWIAGHSLLPITMKGREWLYFGSQHIGYKYRLSFIEGWLIRVMMTWGPHHFNTSIFRTHLYLILALMGIVSLALLSVILFLRSMNRMCTLLTWTIGLNFLYLIIFPSEGHGGRYQPMTLLLVQPLLWLAVLRIVRWVSGGIREGARLKSAGIAFLILAMAVSTTVSFRNWRSLAGQGIDQINQEHGEMAVWIEQNLPADAIARRQIAIFDIGRIGYQIHGSLFDLGGLTDPQYLSYLFGHDVPVFLKANNIRYAVLPYQPGWGLAFWNMLILEQVPKNPVELTQLRMFCFPTEVQLRVWTGTSAATACQVLYSVHFP
jgi:hypothetical protein